MAEHEACCFAEHLGVPSAALRVHPMPTGHPDLDGVDLVLFGGSGAFSVLDRREVPWIQWGIDLLVEVVDRKIPAWASCFGFQGLALALGGEVHHDPSRQEMGATRLHLTEQGAHDPVFGHLPDSFWAQQGHQDCVDRLPPGVVHTVRGDRVHYQAFKVRDAPFWAAQFHPELTIASTMDRARHYAERYMQPHELDGVLAQMAQGKDTPEVGTLLAHLLGVVGGGA